MVRWKLLFTFSFLLVFHSQCQNQWGVEGKFRNGYLAPHRVIMDHLPVERVFAGELSFFIELNDTNSWAHYYHKPRIGISGFFNQTGNTPILGHIFGVFAFGELPFFKTQHLALNARIGTGVAYVTRLFDKIDNPKNNATSSHLNGTVVLGMNLRYSNKNNSFAVGAEMSHISNGSAKLPNLGLNYPFLTFSYGRIIRDFKPRKKEKFVTNYGLPWQIGVNGILSWKEVFPVTGKKYPIYGINVFTRKIFNPKFGVEVVLDGIYKTTIKDYLPEFSKNPMDELQVGLFAGYVLSFDRLTTIVGMGGYLRDKYLPEDRFYHRLGIRYQFKSNLQLGWALKVNWGKADYWEWSVGYVFNRKKK
jgi:hypothetical protein